MGGWKRERVEIARLRMGRRRNSWRSRFVLVLGTIILGLSKVIAEQGGLGPTTEGICAGHGADDGRLQQGVHICHELINQINVQTSSLRLPDVC